MIILSQDREKIINFDNIDSIEVDANVIVIFKNNKRIWIGTYDTIIRAKEVLQQIIDYYNREDFRDEKMDIEKAKVMIMIRDKSAFYMPEK